MRIVAPVPKVGVSSLHSAGPLTADFRLAKELHVWTQAQDFIRIRPIMSQAFQSHLPCIVYFFYLMASERLRYLQHAEFRSKGVCIILYGANVVLGGSLICCLAKLSQKKLLTFGHCSRVTLTPPTTKKLKTTSTQP